MYSLTVGETYCLRLPDGRPLGHVRIDRLVDSWMEGPFSPAPAFAEVRDLFAREAELRHDQAIPLWEEAADAIDALGVLVVSEKEGRQFAGMRLFVEGNE